MRKLVIYVYLLLIFKHFSYAKISKFLQQQDAEDPKISTVEARVWLTNLLMPILGKIRKIQGFHRQCIPDCD